MESDDRSGWELYLLYWRSLKNIDLTARSLLQQATFGSPTDLVILDLLNTDGPAPVNALGQRIFLTSGSITSAVDRLENRGFVARRTRADDRRVVEVTLTADGKRISEKAIKSFKEPFERIRQRLGTSNSDRLARILRDLS
ncbi:MAG: MarR family winged helix-turn-helix transcriptional regulator [Opitutales bacterium]